MNRQELKLMTKCDGYCCSCKLSKHKNCISEVAQTALELMAENEQLKARVSVKEGLIEALRLTK